MMARVMHNVVAITAERNFKKEVKNLCTPIPAADFEQMAVQNVSIAALMKQTGHRFPEYKPNPWVNYLMGLSDQYMIQLLEKDLPNHVGVLRRHPVFCKTFIQDLKRLAGEAQK